MLLQTIARGSRQGSKLTELVSRTALPRPTIHRVLDSLIGLGWVVRDEETKRFNLGQGLAALGYSAISRHPIERVATPVLGPLARGIRQVVYLNIRVGLDSLCIGRFDSDTEVQVGRGWVGMRSPFGATPACMGIISRMSKDEVSEIIDANLHLYYRMHGFDENGFKRDVKESIRVGYGVYGEIVLDRTTSGIGAAIVDSTGQPIAAIGTTFISSWVTERQKMEKVRKMNEAAEIITNRITEF